MSSTAVRREIAFTRPQVTLDCDKYNYFCCPKLSTIKFTFSYFAVINSLAPGIRYFYQIALVCSLCDYNDDFTAIIIVCSELCDFTAILLSRPYIIDLDSTNGTYLNNKRIDPSRYYELKEKVMCSISLSSFSGPVSPILAGHDQVWFQQ